MFPGIKTTICVKPEEMDNIVSKIIIDTGAWEGANVAGIMELVDQYPDAVFMDIGSNIGINSEF